MRTRLLIAYDGSDSARAAIEDLRRAGLGPDVDATVMSVADDGILGDWDEHVLDEPVRQTPATVALTAGQLDAIRDARGIAADGAGHLRRLFPNWEIETAVRTDYPPRAVVTMIDEVDASLVVIGSHGKSALARALLGSVSERVLREAACSVRIGRSRTPYCGEGVRIIFGYDGSPDARVALSEIARRQWPAGSAVRVVSMAEPAHSPVARPPGVYDPFEDLAAHEFDRMHRLASRATTYLASAGLSADQIVRVDDPADGVSTLLSQAEKRSSRDAASAIVFIRHISVSPA